MIEFPVERERERERRFYRFESICKMTATYLESLPLSNIVASPLVPIGDNHRPTAEVAEG